MSVHHNRRYPVAAIITGLCDRYILTGLICALTLLALSGLEVCR